MELLVRPSLGIQESYIVEEDGQRDKQNKTIPKCDKSTKRTRASPGTVFDCGEGGTTKGKIFFPGKWPER